VRVGTICLGAFVGVAISLAGCGQSSPVKLHPVSGKVLYKDQPTENAQVVFQPPGGATKEQPMAYATATADGSFKLRTEYGEGAPVGDYDVMVTWYGEKGNKLPAKYSDQEKPVIKSTVKEGSNALEPFRLK